MAWWARRTVERQDVGGHDTEAPCHARGLVPSWSLSLRQRSYWAADRYACTCGEYPAASPPGVDCGQHCALGNPACAVPLQYGLTTGHAEFDLARGHVG